MVAPHDSGYSEKGHGRQESTPAAKPLGHSRMSSIGKGSGQMVYGIVQYDFNAERPDELEAKAGEAIIVIAQSNPEWFVAKPIGRLGGPGLIPVSFIEIRDMSTGQAVPDAQGAVARAGVPKVEEWKKMAADYKASSISLGKFETTNGGSLQQDMGRMSLNNGSQQTTSSNGRSFVCSPFMSALRFANISRHQTKVTTRELLVEAGKALIGHSHMQNSLPQCLRQYHGTALKMTSIGISLSVFWKMVAIGSCLASTRISTTSRLRSYRNFPGRQTLMVAAGYYRTCLDLSLMSPMLSQTVAEKA